VCKSCPGEGQAAAVRCEDGGMSTATVPAATLPSGELTDADLATLDQAFARPTGRRPPEVH
jgi:hypothetical protein